MVKFSNALAELEVMISRYPHWRTWMFSFFAWSYLIMHASNMNTSSLDKSPPTIISCVPPRLMSLNETSIMNAEKATGTMLYAKISTRFSGSLVPMFIMLAAMMFPLLNYPLIHIARSIKRKHTDAGILFFLAGYSLVWMLFDIITNLLMISLQVFYEDQTNYVFRFLKISAFVAMAVFAALPGRFTNKSSCEASLPISIDIAGLSVDNFRYGLKIGMICLRICWPVMLGLMITGHNIFLMSLVTIILIVDRYFLSHISRLPFYAWTIISIVLLSMEMIN